MVAVKHVDVFNVRRMLAEGGHKGGGGVGASEKQKDTTGRVGSGNEPFGIPSRWCRMSFVRLGETNEVRRR